MEIQLYSFFKDEQSLIYLNKRIQFSEAAQACLICKTGKNSNLYATFSRQVPQNNLKSSFPWITARKHRD